MLFNIYVLHSELIYLALCNNIKAEKRMSSCEVDNKDSHLLNTSGRREIGMIVLHNYNKILIIQH